MSTELKKQKQRDWDTGRKKLYGCKTKQFQRRIPVDFYEEIEEQIDKILDKYKIHNYKPMIK
jgi:hypothetical protein